MRKLPLIFFIAFCLLFSPLLRANLNHPSITSEVHYSSIYKELKGSVKPDFELFEKAYLGYIDLKLSGYLEPTNNIFSLVDFRLPSKEKRFWVIDLESRTILFHTYVAHGENSGKDYALDFSNTVNSHKSSLGYYRTNETYIGKNGLSLRLEGLEYGFNHHARKRYIVLHGADYATEEYLKENGTLGNSEGCPAIPMGVHQSVIEVTKGGSCLFIYFPDNQYLENSNYFFKGF